MKLKNLMILFLMKTLIQFMKKLKTIFKVDCL